MLKEGDIEPVFLGGGRGALMWRNTLFDFTDEAFDGLLWEGL